MRNEIFLKAYAEKICDFNYNEAARETVKKYIPTSDIYARKWMGVWMQEVKDKLSRLREKQREHPEILKILDDFEKTFFFEGHQEYFENLLCTDSEIVLAHHDA